MSDVLDTSREPISELGLDDLQTLSNYNSEINNAKYSNAVKVLDDAQCKKGFRAAIFNKIKEDIINLEIFLLNLTADENTIYSLTEPTEEQMQGKLYWIQPIIY